jgi:hypothetical protein
MGLPTVSQPEQRESIDQGSEPGESLDVVVSHDSKDRDPGAREALDSLLERSDGLETRVGALDDVTGEEHRIDRIRDGALDRDAECRFGCEVAWIHTPVRDVFRNTSRLDSKVDIADRE